MDRRENRRICAQANVMLNDLASRAESAFRRAARQKSLVPESRSVVDRTRQLTNWPAAVQRRVSDRGGIMVATQKTQAGMFLAGTAVTVTGRDAHFRADHRRRSAGRKG